MITTAKRCYLLSNTIIIMYLTLEQSRGAHSTGAHSQDVAIISEKLKCVNAFDSIERIFYFLLKLNVFIEWVDENAPVSMVI